MAEHDYQMAHRPPGEASGAPIHDLTANGVYPADVYTRPDWYNGGEENFWEAFSKVSKRRGKPDGRVRIYRAMPCGAPRSPLVLHKGDWVTTIMKYARDHGKHPHDPSKDMCVGSVRVPNKCIHTAGDSLLEWGYNCDAVTMLKVFHPRKRPLRKG